MLGDAPRLGDRHLLPQPSHSAAAEDSSPDVDSKRSARRHPDQSPPPQPAGEALLLGMVRHAVAFVEEQREDAQGARCTLALAVLELTVDNALHDLLQPPPDAPPPDANQPTLAAGKAATKQQPKPKRGPAADGGGARRGTSTRSVQPTFAAVSSLEDAERLLRLAVAARRPHGSLFVHLALWQPAACGRRAALWDDGAPASPGRADGAHVTCSSLTLAHLGSLSAGAAAAQHAQQQQQLLVSVSKLVAELAARQGDATGASQPVATRDSRLAGLLAPLLAGNVSTTLLVALGGGGGGGVGEGGGASPRQRQQALVRLAQQAASVRRCLLRQRLAPSAAAAASPPALWGAGEAEEALHARAAAAAVAPQGVKSRARSPDVGARRVGRADQQVQQQSANTPGVARLLQAGAAAAATAAAAAGTPIPTHTADPDVAASTTAAAPAAPAARRSQLPASSRRPAAAASSAPPPQPAAPASPLRTRLPSAASKLRKAPAAATPAPAPAQAPHLVQRRAEPPAPPAHDSPAAAVPGQESLTALKRRLRRDLDALTAKMQQRRAASPAPATSPTPAHPARQPPSPSPPPRPHSAHADAARPASQGPPAGPTGSSRHASPASAPHSRRGASPPARRHVGSSYALLAQLHTHYHHHPAPAPRDAQCSPGGAQPATAEHGDAPPSPASGGVSGGALATTPRSASTYSQRLHLQRLQEEAEGARRADAAQERHEGAGGRPRSAPPSSRLSVGSSGDGGGEGGGWSAGSRALHALARRRRGGPDWRPDARTVSAYRQGVAADAAVLLGRRLGGNAGHGALGRRLASSSAAAVARASVLDGRSSGGWGAGRGDGDSSSDGEAAGYVLPGEGRVGGEEAAAVRQLERERQEAAALVRLMELREQARGGSPGAATRAARAGGGALRHPPWNFGAGDPGSPPRSVARHSFAAPPFGLGAAGGGFGGVAWFAGRGLAAASPRSASSSPRGRGLLERARAAEAGLAAAAGRPAAFRRAAAAPQQLRHGPSELLGEAEVDLGQQLRPLGGPAHAARAQAALWGAAAAAGGIDGQVSRPSAQAPEAGAARAAGVPAVDTAPQLSPPPPAEQPTAHAAGPPPAQGDERVCGHGGGGGGGGGGYAAQHRERLAMAGGAGSAVAVNADAERGSDVEDAVPRVAEESVSLELAAGAAAPPGSVQPGAAVRDEVGERDGGGAVVLQGGLSGASSPALLEGEPSLGPHAWADAPDRRWGGGGAAAALALRRSSGGEGDEQEEEQPLEGGWEGAGWEGAGRPAFTHAERTVVALEGQLRGVLGALRRERRQREQAEGALKAAQLSLLEAQVCVRGC